MTIDIAGRLRDAGGAGTPPTVVQIRQEMDSNSIAFTSLLGGVIKANTVGGFHIQMLDTAGNPVAGAAVTMTKRLDTNSFTATTGSASNTDSDGLSYIAYSAADVNGTSAVSFKFTSPGAVKEYERFKLSP